MSTAVPFFPEIAMRRLNRAIGFSSKMTKKLLCSFRILSALLLMWVNLGLLHAETSDRTIGQFVHTSWSVKDGAPSNAYALAQTTDGFLWLGTTQGLYRFDGVTFERYEPQSGPPFQSYFVTSLLALPDGDLWIGFHEKGVSRLRGGRNINYTSAEGLPAGGVVSLTQDSEGAIWAGTDGGLARFEHERWQRISSDWGFPGARAGAVYVDRLKTLWVAAENTMVFLPPGSRRFQTTGTQIGLTRQIVESPDGTPWMAETTRSVHPLFLPTHPHGLEPEIQVGSRSILFDDDGSLWVTSIGDGMRRVPIPDRLNGQKIGEFSDAIESFTSRDGLSSDYVTCILKDREGSIWVSTLAGLDRFRKGALVPMLLPVKFSNKVLVTGDRGDIWVGSMNGALARFEGNTRRDVSFDYAIDSGFRDSHGTIWFVAGYRDSDDSDQTIWGLVRMDNGRPKKIAAAPPGFAFSVVDPVGVADSMDRPWLGGDGENLFFLNNEKQWRHVVTPSELAGKRALVAFADATGHLWYGFTENSIAVIEGTIVRTFAAKDGIQVGSIMAITGHDSHIWIGGQDGLAVREGERFRSVVPADGDTFHGISGIQQDAYGDLFLSELRGVVFIPATEVARVLKDTSARVHYQLFDAHDGLSGTIQQTPPYPTAAQGTDGRIWFSGSTGAAWIDPSHIAKNLLEPPIAIRAITANGIRYASSAGLNLPPRTQDLTIDYTALSLAIAERVRFRYKLEGSDAQWQDAGVRRQAFYTNLSPGQYVFHVTASNNDGIWNETGASLSFVITPAWYQTIWFRGLCALVFFTMLWAGYQLRVQQLRGEERKLREAIETIPAMAWISGPDGVVQFRNRRWVEYTGLSQLVKAEEVGTVALHAEDRDRIALRLRASFATGEPFEDEMRIRRTDGEYRWFLCRAVPLRDARGKVMKWYGAATDIQDRKRAEQLQAEFAHTNRVSTMGQMVASISHELAQPITVTIAHAKASLQWLQRDPPEVSQARKGTEKIVEAGALASEIISRLRSLYKKAPPKRELVAMNEVVGEMAEMMGGEARGHGISIRTDLKDNLPMTVADRVQLQQVLMNLILNGIEAMKDMGGVITVKSQLGEDGQIQVSIHDTGPGLPPGKADQVFDAFFTTKPQGSGMGLAISKSIVESQGGRIWVDGEGGGGATFHIALAVASADAKFS